MPPSRRNSPPSSHSWDLLLPQELHQQLINASRQSGIGVSTLVSLALEKYCADHPSLAKALPPPINATASRPSSEPSPR